MSDQEETMRYAVDYSWARPSPAAIKAAGFEAVCRYISHDRTGKSLTGAEAEDLIGAGLGVVLNFEDSAARPLAGGQAGFSDCVFANGYADMLGAPASVPIYFSCDTDPGSPIRPEITAYFRAMHDVGGRRPVGVYGGAGLINVVKAMFPGEKVYGWRSSARSWSHGVSADGMDLDQLLGHPNPTPQLPGFATDTNLILSSNYGAWGLGNVDDMTPEEHKMLQSLNDLIFGGIIPPGATGSMVHDIQTMIRKVQTRVDKLPTAAQIADAVIAKLPPSSGGVPVVDIHAIAVEVADELHARLAG